MYQDFIAALNKNYQCTGEADLSGLDLQHYTFATTTNARGMDTLKIFEAYGFSLAGLKILDIGCAYGGFAIEAARRGAHCWGVEIVPRLYELAVLNYKNEVCEGNCNFILADATSPEFLKKVPRNYFDLIIVNDVFEHVYDTVQLLHNLSQTAGSTCAIYFLIPNGNNLRFAAREGHTGNCGLSLLRPLLWRYAETGRWDENIYYRQYEYYQALFRQFGFGVIDCINYPGYAERTEVGRRIEEEYKQVEQTVREKWDGFSEAHRMALKPALERFDCQLCWDLQHMSASELDWKYLTRFWGGLAQKKTLNLTPLKQTVERRSRSDRDGDDIQFVLSLEGDILCSLNISGCRTTSGNYVHQGFMGQRLM